MYLNNQYMKGKHGNASKLCSIGQEEIKDNLSIL